MEDPARVQVLEGAEHARERQRHGLDRLAACVAPEVRAIDLLGHEVGNAIGETELDNIQNIVVPYPREHTELRRKLLSATRKNTVAPPALATSSGTSATLGAWETPASGTPGGI